MKYHAYTHPAYAAIPVPVVTFTCFSQSVECSQINAHQLHLALFLRDYKTLCDEFSYMQRLDIVSAKTRVFGDLTYILAVKHRCTNSMYWDR